MLREKMLWLILGFLMACLMIIPYHVKVMDDFNNKYKEQCLIVDVVISDSRAGLPISMSGEQMMCGSNWTNSFIYFPGFDEHLERMWQDEQKENPLQDRKPSVWFNKEE